MSKRSSLWILCLLCLTPQTNGADEKAADPTLADDWKVLCAAPWVNADPKEAWKELSVKWQKQYPDGFFKIEVKLVGKLDEGRIGWRHYVKGQAEPVIAVNADVILAEEKGRRYLLIGADNAKIKYSLEGGVLRLDGLIKDPDDVTAAHVFTGEYKALEKK